MCVTYIYRHKERYQKVGGVATLYGKTKSLTKIGASFHAHVIYQIFGDRSLV